MEQARLHSDTVAMVIAIANAHPNASQPLASWPYGTLVILLSMPKDARLLQIVLPRHVVLMGTPSPHGCSRLVGKLASRRWMSRSPNLRNVVRRKACVRAA